MKCWKEMLRFPYWRAGVSLCSESTPGEHLDYLEGEGIHCIVSGKAKVNLRMAIQNLVSLLINPCAVGGITPQTFFRAEDLTSPEGVIDLELIHCEEIKNGVVWVRYSVT